MSLESHIRELTRPINGQYPRPWMTALSDPSAASVFEVGLNQATPYPVEVVGSERVHLDSLFNRNGQTCRALYEQVRKAAGKKGSPTRKNTDRLTDVLRSKGIEKVLETNVICYSTPRSTDLGFQEHAGGHELGRRIFHLLLEEIRPRCSSSTAQRLGANCQKRSAPHSRTPSTTTR